MRFVIAATDKPGSAALRAATRERHLAYLDAQISQLVLAGPLLNAEGQAIGSLLVVEAADRAAIDAFAAADPYAQAELFESVTIHPFRAVYQDGARLG